MKPKSGDNSCTVPMRYETMPFGSGWGQVIRTSVEWGPLVSPVVHRVADEVPEELQLARVQLATRAVPWVFTSYLFLTSECYLLHS